MCDAGTVAFMRHEWHLCCHIAACMAGAGCRWLRPQPHCEPAPACWWRFTSS